MNFLTKLMTSLFVQARSQTTPIGGGQHFSGQETKGLVYSTKVAITVGTAMLRKGRKQCCGQSELKFPLFVLPLVTFWGTLVANGIKKNVK